MAIMLLATTFYVNMPTVKAANKKEYILGVFPHLPPRELEKVFSPMAADISKVIGRPVIFRTSSTYKKFMQQLDKQVFDIAFVQPFDYIRAADKYGYLPLATRQEVLSAIIVTQGDKITHVKHLKGKSISLPPKVAAVSHLVKDFLTNNKLTIGKDVKLSYHKSHVSCMQQVLIGKTDACGTALPALRFFQHKMKVKLNIIGKSRDIPHTLFSIHPRVPGETRNKIQKQILNWGKTEQGMMLLRHGRLKPLRKIKDSDYDVVRHMAK